MRLAFLSDIHGNPIALAAVLQDIANLGGADGYYAVGDFCAIGYDPVTVLEMLIELPNIHFVRGNTDRYAVSLDRPYPSLDDVRDDISLLQRLVDVHNGFSWTRGYLTGAGWLQWMLDLPLEQRTILPDGTRLLLVHASPGCDDGTGFTPAMSDDEFREKLIGCQADLVIVGHTHWPLDRTVDGVRVINLGCVSNPLLPDLRASYVILDCDEQGYKVRFRRADYDRLAVIEAIQKAKYPVEDFLIQNINGFDKENRDWPIFPAN